MIKPRTFHKIGPGAGAGAGAGAAPAPTPVPSPRSGSKSESPSGSTSVSVSESKSESESESTALPIIYMDEDFVVIDKPAGLISQPSMDPKRKSALGILEKQLGQKLFLHHRLDRETSGVLVFVKNPSINGAVTDLFRDRLVEKTYVCLCRVNEKRFRTEGDDFSVACYMAPVKRNHRIERMVIVKSGGWQSETRFHIEKKSSSPHERLFLVRAFPRTGRTHQIRVHLSSVGLPIAGDFLYGGRGENFPRMFLHAEKMKFVHPVKKIDMEFVAPTPLLFSSDFF